MCSNQQSQHNLDRLTSGWSRTKPLGRWLLWVVALSIGLPFVVGCSGNQLKNGVFKKGDLRYTVGSLPKTWRRISVAENDLAFFNPSFGSVIQANSTCRADYEDASLSTLTSHLFNGLTNRKITQQAERIVDRRAALYTELTARLDGVLVQTAILLLKKNECVFDFAYYARPHRFGSGVGDFHRFIYGFRVLP